MTALCWSTGAALAQEAADSAPGCQGLACSGVLPPESAAHDPNVPTVASPDDLNGIPASGYYAFRAAGNQRVVVYAVAAGDWASAPAEIKQLPLGDDLLPAERSSKWLVIYGSGAMMSGPWPAKASASAAHHGKRRGPRAHTSAASDCVSPWFCVFTNTSFTGNKCQWQSTSVWQVMPSSCYADAESMVNRRNAW